MKSKLIPSFQDLFDDLTIKTVLVLPGDEKVKAVLREASKYLNIVEIDVEASATSDLGPPQANQENGVALYLHTSGTTGKPKAVPLRHSNLIRGAKNVAETYDLTSQDRTYLLQVLFHIHGIVAAFLAPLTTGGSIVIPVEGKLNASCAWADFNEQGCSWVTGTPSILQTLLAAPAYPLPDIRFMRSCSSPLLPTVFKALSERLKCPVIEAYAMTEASHQMCSNRLDSFSSGTVGPESGTTRVCIWDGGDQACQLGQEGEVSVCGENVMDGYEGVSPEKNKEAFWHGKDERGHEARWFKTGDRGVLSTDGQRRLTLIGRLSEMVNRGGEKISPVEVDEAMMLIDGVKEAASFSVTDEFYGQEIEAAVVLTEGSKLDEGSLQELLEDRLAKFKIPKRIHVCEGSIPKGNSHAAHLSMLEHLCADTILLHQAQQARFNARICPRSSPATALRLLAAVKSRPTSMYTASSIAL
jgi:acyl-CoA synthetase (AMP-forming)/AMP-acid ligase II